MVLVGECKVEQVVARPEVTIELTVITVIPGTLRVAFGRTERVTVQHASLGLDFTLHAGGVVQGHVLRDRGMESGEISLAEVDRVPARGPLPATPVPVTASGQGGFLVQARIEERHQVVVHNGILDDGPCAGTSFTTVALLQDLDQHAFQLWWWGGGRRSGAFTWVHGRLATEGRMAPGLA